MVARFNGSDPRVALFQSIIASHLGVDAVYESQYDRMRLHSDDRLQSRLDKNRAPKHMVERFAHQMGESVFPPIIVTRDGLKVDGNTRDAAHSKRGDRFISALVIPIDYASADEHMQEKLVNLSRALNNMNGLPLDDDERRMYAYGMMKEHASDEEIVTRVGLSLSKIRELREQYKGSQRLLELGVDLHEQPTGSVLRAFGKAKMDGLDEEGVRGIYQLSTDAGMKATEISALATSLQEAGSDEMRRERIARERQAREEQITTNQTGQRTVNLAGKLQSRLAILDEHPLNVFMERNEERVDEYVQDLIRHRDQLTDLIALHQGTQPGMPPLSTTATTPEVRPS